MSSNSARVRFSAALGRASAPRPAGGFRVAEPEPSGRSPLARLSFASTRARGRARRVEALPRRFRRRRRSAQKRPRVGDGGVGAARRARRPRDVHRRRADVPERLCHERRLARCHASVRVRSSRGFEARAPKPAAATSTSTRDGRVPGAIAKASREPEGDSEGGEGGEGVSDVSFIERAARSSRSISAQSRPATAAILPGRTLSSSSRDRAPARDVHHRVRERRRRAAEHGARRGGASSGGGVFFGRGRARRAVAHRGRRRGFGRDGGVAAAARRGALGARARKNPGGSIGSGSVAGSRGVGDRTGGGGGGALLRRVVLEVFLGARRRRRASPPWRRGSGAWPRCPPRRRGTGAGAELFPRRRTGRARRGSASRRSARGRRRRAKSASTSGASSFPPARSAAAETSS